ncbi:hypothetical protein [Glutamicibacter protophormiae]|uniref:hypothetical protein n=1 Tax=Glutamicibacter protophormiae TaxID=37930 RepID=UPI001956E359|nr:hypothetical protein [Glutamicibacter protophormiae]QRQ79144.1 hypothetical protein JQN66_02505 [Glutamicibacter protophormiae]
MLRLTLTYAIPAAHIWQSQKDYTSKEITMSNLPGNPFAERAEKADYRSLTPATLALAYEQRLATLATLFNTPDNSAIPGVDYAEAARQLSEGLGMRAEK